MEEQTKVVLYDGKALTTSLKVAETFGKQHKNVLQSIDALTEEVEKSGLTNRLNFQPIEYKDAKGRQQKMYAMDRDAFTMLAMGFTGAKVLKFKLEYISAFNAMEKMLREQADKASLKYRLPYHLHRYVANHFKIPHGYFSILSELAIRLIAPLEMQGYTLLETLVPDISEGRMFCRWLREEKGVEPNSFPTYTHEYGDGREVQAKLYPIELLSDFVAHFQNTWLPEQATKYFEKRDQQALQYLPKLLKQHSAN